MVQQKHFLRKGETSGLDKKIYFIYNLLQNIFDNYY